MKHLVLILFMTMLNVAFSAASELRKLCVNRMPQPLDIVRMGQFSWQIESEENDVRQIAYHIKVASSEEGLQGGRTLMWDSERRESADMVQVFYQGRRFPYESIVYWQLQVWLSNGEHLTSAVQQIQTGSRGTEWNATPVTKADSVRNYFYYLRWLHTLQMNQADSGELFLPIPDDEKAIPVERAAAVLYSLYRDEGDVVALQRYYYMVKRWMIYQCQKDTVSMQLVSMMSEMAQRQNLQADVLEFSRIKGDSTAYEPYWLYPDEPEWNGGAIRQVSTSIAYSRVELFIPSLSKQETGAVSHQCPYGLITSEWSRDEEGVVSWKIALPVGVQAQVLFPEGYANAEGLRSQVLGSGRWILRIEPTV